MNKGIELIKEFEGCKLEAYLCPAKVWTIGYGSTFYEDGSKVAQGDNITQERAERLLRNMVEEFEAKVKRLITSAVNDNQLGALTSFAFNLGVGAFKGSTLRSKVNANPNDSSIAAEFAKWNKAGGKVLAGLTRRRTAEASLYFDTL